MGIPAAPTLLIHQSIRRGSSQVHFRLQGLDNSQPEPHGPIILSDKSQVKRTLLIIAFDIELSIAKTNSLYNKFLSRNMTFSLPSK